MNRERTRLILQLLLYTGLATFAALPVLAQVPVDEDGNPIAPLEQEAALEDYEDEELPVLSVAELEDIVGPVALYPDDLLAVVLPASTYPLQVVQAARFLERLETDSSLKPDEEWDESITALLNYPEVVDLMNEDIDWTWRLGEAVVTQQADVIAAIESFRDKAYAAGNLKSDDRQTVSNEDGVIEIEPASEDVIYVPYYEPEQVVVYQPQPVYHYYPYAYPVYYYPYPYGYSFASSYFWGVTTAFTIGWLTDHLHVYHHSYWGHPYYGHSYHSNYYYRRPSLHHYNNYYVHNSHSYSDYRYRDGDYWRPRHHGGARPGHDRQRAHYYRDRNRDDWSHRGNDRDTRIGFQARNRDGDRSRGADDSRRRDRNGGASNSGNIRDRRGDGDRQASNRDRGNPADRRDRNSSGSSDRNDISFRSRDARARADQERRRTGGSGELSRGSERRSSFAPSARTTTTASNNRRPSPRSLAPSRSSDRTAGLSNPRRQVQPSPPRQASRPTSQRPPTTTQPQRSAPTRSAPPPSAAPSRAPQQSSGGSRRSESRSSRSSSRGSSNRGESRSRQRH
jgi:hypothetical protein